MPHLIDHETGLCEVCQRLKLANVRDMKVHKRLGFEARKKAVEKIKTTLKDPRHQRIVNNNYVHYETTKHNYFNVDTEDKTGVTIQNRLPKNVPLSREMHFTQTAGIGITNLATIDEQTVLVNETSRKTTIKKTVNKDVPANLVDYRYNSAVVMSKTKEPRATVVVKMNNKEKFTKLSQINLERALKLRKQIKPAFNLVRRSIRPNGIKYIQPILRQFSQPNLVTTRPIISNPVRRQFSNIISGRPKVYIVKEPNSQPQAFFHHQPLALSAPPKPKFLAIQAPPEPTEITLNKEFSSSSIISPDHIVLTPKQSIDGPIKEMSFAIRTGNDNRPMFANSGTVVPVNNRPVVVRNMATVQDVQPKIIYASSLNKQPVIMQSQLQNKAQTQEPTYTMYREPSEVSVFDFKEKKAKVKTISREQPDDASVHSLPVSTNSEMGYRNSRKLLSGFHPYYDKESDILHLQCCTCCIGCCRKCSTRCTGCENFMSCPIYCWVCFIVPIFLLLCGAVVLTSLLASYKISIGGSYTTSSG